jgi:hypothetical protein
LSNRLMRETGLGELHDFLSLLNRGRARRGYEGLLYP